MRTLLLLCLLSLVSFPSNSKELVDFELKEFKTKQTIKLSDLTKTFDKIVINFWASWCTGCIKELPELNKLTERYKDKKIAFLAINAGERKRKIKKFLKRNKFSFKILVDKNRKYSKSVGIMNLPQTIVVDKKLKILYHANLPPKDL